jgi:hypothetical protein
MSGTEGTGAEVVTDRAGHAWVDFFSWGHVAMGIGLYTVSWFIVSLTAASGRSYLSFIITFVLGCWLWEEFENNVVYSWGLKYADKQDSLNNMLGDQFFVTIGAVIMWIVEIIIYGNDPTYWFYILGGIGLLICLIGFFISKAVHDKNYPPAST